MATKVPPQSDARELLRSIADSDEASFIRLYEEYGQRLYAYALRVVGNPVLADDVLQESCLAIWLGARNFRGDGRPIAWMLGIVHNKALKALREKPLHPIEPLEERLHDAGTPGDEIMRIEREQGLRAGLDALSKDHRLVLELVFYQGLSLQETAQVCACSLGTVKSRLSYAKKALRGELVRAGMQVESI